jgi:hypothetical protein
MPSFSAFAIICWTAGSKLFSWTFDSSDISPPIVGRFFVGRFFNFLSKGKKRLSKDFKTFQKHRIAVLDAVFQQPV